MNFRVMVYPDGRRVLQWLGDYYFKTKGYSDRFGPNVITVWQDVPEVTSEVQDGFLHSRDVDSWPNGIRPKCCECGK